MPSVECADELGQGAERGLVRGMQHEQVGMVVAVCLDASGVDVEAIELLEHVALLLVVSEAALLIGDTLHLVHRQVPGLASLGDVGEVGEVDPAEAQSSQP